MHTAHDSYEFNPAAPVLSDGCPRCTEHAERPSRTLDNEHCLELLRRGRERDFRSALDQRAHSMLRWHMVEMLATFE